MTTCGVLAEERDITLSSIKHRKLSWFDHVCIHSAEIHTTGPVHGAPTYSKGRPRKSLMNNIKEWIGQSLSSLLHIANDRSRYEAITAEASVGEPRRRPGVTGFS